MKILTRFFNLFKRGMCPSGLNHRIKIGIVRDTFGNEWCCHEDCMNAVIDRYMGTDKEINDIEVGQEDTL